MPFTRITVQEQYETSIGTPAAGSVEFTPVDQMHNGSLVISAPESDILDSSGNLSIVLAATTDPATTPVGVTYRVVERILGQPVRTYYVAVPHNQGSPLQLADLPSSSTGGTAGFALRNAIDYDDGTPPVDGQAMVWDSTTSKFHPESVSGVGSTVTAVNGQTGAVTVSPASIGAQPVDSDLTTIAALAPTDGSLLERVGGVWQARTPAQVKGDLALDLVNNTPDVAKPVSTAAQTALNTKAPLASPTFTGTVAAPRLVGNLVVVAYAASVTLDASAGSTFRCVATGSLAVTAINGGVQGQEVKLEVQASGGARTVTVNGIASTVASGEWGTWRLTWNQTTSLWVLNDLPAPSAGGSVTSVNGQAGAVTITATGLGAQPVDSDLTDLAALTPTNGDLIERVGGVWSARSSAQVKGDLALDQVNNTTDLAKPLSTAATAALAGKAPLADPVFTGTPTAPRFVGAVAAVAYAAALTLNAAAASTHQVTATGDITSVAITGGSNGQSVRLQVFASGADRTVTAFGVATTVPSGTWGGVGWTYNQSSNVWIQDRTTITGGGGAVSSVNGQTGAVSVTATSIGAQPADSDLTVIAALGPTDGSVLSRQGGVWTGRTTAQVKTDMGIDLVDNTSDANKPISNAAAASLAAKAPLVSPALSNPTANRFIGAVQVVTYAASVTLDASVATTFRVAATGPLTIADVTNGANGQEIALEVLASGGDRVLTVGGSTITITAGLWWIGTLRYDQPRDTWKLTDSNGGTTGGGGGVPDDGSVTNAKVATNAGIDLDKTTDSATRLAMSLAERTLLSSGLTERIQDDAATLLTAGVHTGLTATYVDASNRVDLVVTSSAGTDPIAQAIAKAPLVAADTHTRPDGALGTAETGQVWETQTGTPTIVSNRVTSAAVFTAALPVGRSDLDVSCELVPQAGTAASLGFRMGTTVADRLQIALDMANGFRLSKVDTSVNTPLSTVAQTFTAGTAYTVRVVAVGGLITCYLDGIPLISNYALTTAEQTKYAAFTRVGYRLNAAVAGVTFGKLLVRLPPVGGGSGAAINATLIDAPGDLIAGSAADTAVRVPVGPDGQTLVADSTQVGGIGWLGNSVYVVATGDDSDLTTALAAAPASATLVAVKVAGT